MAKLRAPAFSFVAHGQLGKSILFDRYAHANIARSYFIPTDTRAPSQLAQRNIIRSSFSAWSSSGILPVDKAALDLFGGLQKVRQSGYNVFVKRHSLAAGAGLAPAVMSGGLVSLGGPVGLDWSQVQNPTADSFIFSLFAGSGGYAFAGSNGAGRIGRSVDSGDSWTDLGTQYGQGLICDVCDLGGGVVLAGGAFNGLMLRSTNYGASFSNLGQQFGASYVWCFCNLGGGVVVCGLVDPGMVIRSDDYGASWSVVSSLNNPVYCGCLADLGGGVVLAGTSNNATIWRSEDYGASWTQCGAPVGSTMFQKLIGWSGGVACVSSTFDGLIYRTADYGDSWDLVYTSANNDRFNGACAVPGGQGFFAGGNPGQLYRTPDYGLTWDLVPYFIGGQNLTALSYSSDGYLLCGSYGNGYLYKSLGGGGGFGFLLSEGGLDIDVLCGLTKSTLNKRVQCTESGTPGTYIIPVGQLPSGPRCYLRPVSRSGADQVVAGIYIYEP